MSELTPPIYLSLLQEKLSYPDSPPQLQGREQENGLLSLIEYLTQATTLLVHDYYWTILFLGPAQVEQ